MVKNRRRQIALLVILGMAAAGSLYYGLNAGPSRSLSGKAAKSSGAASFELDDVLPIDLARVAKLRETAGKGGGVDFDFERDSGGTARGARGVAAGAGAGTPPTTTVPPGTGPGSVVPGTEGLPGAGPPAAPSLPPMNLRYLGAVQVPDGNWFAALVTDRKELLTGKEGDVIANRFRIVKIGVESIDLLETTSGRQRRVRLGGSS
jgi:hypothetical protein